MEIETLNRETPIPSFNHLDGLLTYERRDLIDRIVEAIKPSLRDGEKIIWRHPFRWNDEKGFMSNHYECQDINYICEDHGYQLIHNFYHVAVVKPLARAPETL